MSAQLLRTNVVLGCIAVILAVVGLGAGVAPGPDRSMQDAAAPSNEMCPVMTDEPVDPEISTTYEGHEVFFCCRRCLRQFDRNPLEYAIHLAALAPQDTHAHDEHDSPEHDAAHQDAAQSSAARDESDEHEHDGTDGHAHDNAEDSTQQAASSDHDHEHDHGSELPAFLQWLGNFHPPSVNFPVGLLVAAALAELLLIVTRRSWFASAARFCIWIGALGAIVAASLGWFFGGIQLTDSDWIMTTHRWLGTSTAILALIVLGLSESHHRQPDAPARSRWYRGALFLSAVLVSATGFFGGAMTYGIDHYAW